MKAQAKESRVINASAEDIFRILIDPEHHKHILPPAFVNYGPEPGSKDIVRFTLKSGPFLRHFRTRTEVVEENRIFHEIDTATGFITVFQLSPRDRNSTEVTINTEWESSDNLSGFIEGKLAPLFLQSLYKQELEKLASYSQHVDFPPE